MFFPKLIVTDLDGTALKNDKTISDRTIQAFSRCEQMGIPVAIATARYIYGARPYAEALHARYQILTDGTLIYENAFIQTVWICTLHGLWFGCSVSTN